MRIVLAALLVAAACSDDPGPHDLVDCDRASWDPSAQLPPTGECEAACWTMPDNFTGSGDENPCYYKCTVGGETLGGLCDRTFLDWNGTQGCCQIGGGNFPAAFFCECERPAN